MKTGTKSVLFGAHCFFLHPLFVAAAWFKLFGFRQVADPYLGSVSLWNFRLWLCFLLHDIGYLGKPNMDGEEGEEHPATGGNIMHYFGAQWFNFVYFHSRFLAKRRGRPYSMLCVADKLAVALEPWWFYLPRAIASGEIKEYMRDGEEARKGKGKYAGEPHTTKAPYKNRRDWFMRMRNYMRDWSFEHRDGKQDNWTPTTLATKRT